MDHSGERATEQSDTTPRAQARYLERLRETSPRARLERALRLSEQVRDATMSDIRRQHPGASERELAQLFVTRVYGAELAARLRSRSKA